MTGCATTDASERDGKAVLSVTVPGGGTPTRQEISEAYQAVSPRLRELGLEIAAHEREAEYIVEATYAPDPLLPGQGTYQITSIQRARPNPAPESRGDPALQQMRDNVQRQQAWATSRPGPMP